MYYETEMNVKMENELMAVEALKVMKAVLAQINETEDTPRKAIEEFADSLEVKGSEIVTAPECGLLNTTCHIVLPEMFIAVARRFYNGKFSGSVGYSGTYDWEDFDICYEDGKLIIKSLHHDYCEEPDCPECDDSYEYINEDGFEGYRCCDCGHTISVEEFNAACEESSEEVYEIL